jgi:hypothetical protein
MLTSSRGCVSEQEAMLLIGERATRTNVLAVLAMMARWPPEHLGIAFFGHGGLRGMGLADKALDYEDELLPFVERVGARTTTIILGTCHAAAAARTRVGATFGGEGAPQIYRAWFHTLAGAFDGLRFIAAVGETEEAHGNAYGGWFAGAWLHALRYAPGDIPAANGLWFLSEEASVRRAAEHLARTRPAEPRPRLIAECPGGTLPVILSQAEAPIGVARVAQLHAHRSDPAADLVVELRDRRRVATFVSWTAMAMTKQPVSGGRVELLAQSAAESFRLPLAVDARRLLSHPVLSAWLHSYAGLALTWRVRLTDDHGYVLDERHVHGTYWRVATPPETYSYDQG